MEVEKATKTARHNRHRPKRGRKICLTITAIVIAIAILFLILGLTVFKAKHPVTTINSVSLDDLQVSLDIPRLRVNLNLSLNLNISVKNPNKVGFKFTNSSAIIKYKDQVVGEVPIPAGKIPSDGTKVFQLKLTILADRLLSNSNLYSDVLSGTLPLTTYTKVSGKVSILGFIKFHVTSQTTCDIVVDISSKGISSQECKYKTKL